MKVLRVYDFNFYFWFFLFSMLRVGAQAESSAPSDLVIPEIMVLGSSSERPSQHSTLGALPVTQEISGSRLDRKKRATLGETLAHETGITANSYGPNASRPVVRGLDGDRVRLLQNGTNILDASSVSPDHAVAVEPLTLDRIEILRGPAALLYSSQVSGGVINLISHRIPEKVPEKVSAHGEMRFSSTDLGRSGSYGGDTYAGRHWAFHWEAAERASDDVHAPGVPHGRIYNSFNRSGAAAVGTSYVFERGFWGTSYSDDRSKYGTAADPDVYIKMGKQQWDMAGEVRDLRGWGPLTSVRIKNAFSHYKHDEVENGAVGTRFKNYGDEARLDFRHQPLGLWQGNFGLQMNAFKFSAQGDEAFLPGTENSTYSVFLYEERSQGRFTPSWGGRYDLAKVASQEGPVKEFHARSFSLGMKYELTAQQSLFFSAAMTERAPNYEELFADGPHLATGQFISGDVGLGKEQNRSVDLSWRHQNEAGKSRVGVFLQDFTNFISLAPTGLVEGGTHLPMFQYQGIKARLYGAEVEFRYQLPFLLSHGTLEVEVKGDMVRGQNRNTGHNLPRIPPFRESISLVYKTRHYQADFEIQRSERATLTAPFETPTSEYTLFNMDFEIPVSSKWASFNIIGQIHNIFNTEAKNHVSAIKDLAPLSGRNIALGLQAYF